MATRETPPAAMTGSAQGGSRSYLEAGPVFGGSALAIAIAVVLWQFGAAVGLAVGEPVLDGGSASWNVLVAGLWAVWVALASAGAGGYVAGRMRARWGDAAEHEVEFRDGVHGLVVWAVATIATVALLAALSAAGATAAAADRELTPDAARIAQNVSVIFAFATAAAAALGAAAAWWTATAGGAHRDQGVALQTVVVPAVFRKRR